MSLIKVTEKKRDANARNAQRSTGPKTAEGRQRSSRNAVTHGCASAQVHKPIHGEPEDHFRSTLSKLLEAWAPADHKEEQLVNAIAVSWIRIERSERWESTILNSVMETRARNLNEWLVGNGREPRRFEELDGDLGACIAMVDEKANGAKMWKENQRHSTKAWREWQNAVDTLRKIQDKRLARTKSLEESADMGLNCPAVATPLTHSACAGTVAAGESPITTNQTATPETASTTTAPARTECHGRTPPATVPPQPRPIESTDMGPICRASNSVVDGEQASAHQVTRDAA